MLPNVYIETRKNPLYTKGGSLRFEEVAKIVSGDVLDVGCGFGGLESYLKDCTYTGIDALPWTSGACIDVMDYTKQHDWVVALGIVETCEDLPALAEKLKSLAKIGVVVSSCTRCNPPFISYSEQDMLGVFGGEVIHLDEEEILIICRM